MNNEVEGVIEGADRQHDAARLAIGMGEAMGGGIVEPHRDFGAAQLIDLFDRDLDPVDGAREFNAGVGERLAALARRL